MSTVKLTGFKELDNALRELPKATAKNVLKRVATKAMDRVVEGMSQRAPRDEADRDDDGRHLADTMRTQSVKATRQPGQVRFDARNSVEVISGPAPVGKRARSNAGWQERGTVKMPPHAYARPTADAEAHAVVNDVGDMLEAEIKKAKARIARKAARG